jgi:DNA-binding NarL/FixJ family response regulator
MKLLIVDDHPVFRQGFVALVTQEWPDAEVAQAHDGAQALRMVAERRDLDIVVLDLMMPGSAGVDVIARIGAERPDLPVLVLSTLESEADIRGALARGASGYVAKSAAPSTLISAIRLVLTGEIYVPPLVLGQAPPAQSTDRRLTPRQMDVLRLLAEGYSNKRIATLLGLSEKTVKTHLASIFRLLDADSRTHAIAAARHQSLL